MRRNEAVVVSHHDTWVRAPIYLDMTNTHDQSPAPSNLANIVAEASLQHILAVSELIHEAHLLAPFLIPAFAYSTLSQSNALF